MASVQYGAIITDLKGKIGGQVFQNGNVAKVLRNKGYRAGTSSLARQAANRGLVSQTTAWRALSSANKTLWETYAPTWSFTDKYGNSYIGTGYQVFVAYNSGLISMGLNTVDSPAVATSPELITVGSAIYSLAVGPVIDWNSTTAAIQVAQIFATPSMSMGVNNNNKRYKLIGNINTDVYPGYTGAAGYEAAWGVPFLDAKVIFKIQLRLADFPRIFQTITIPVQVEA